MKKSVFWITGAAAVLILSFSAGIMMRRAPNGPALPKAPEEGANSFLAAVPLEDPGQTIGGAKPSGGKLPDPKANRNTPFGKFSNLKHGEPSSSVLQTGQGAMLLGKHSFLSQYEGYPASGKAEELYKGAIPLIGKIIKAEKSFFAKNSAYTANLKNLNLEFNDISGQNETEDISIIYLNNRFYYIITKKFAAVYYNGPQREADRYYMLFAFDGRISCIAENLRARQTCMVLGGNLPAANKQIPSWTEYSIPESSVKFSSEEV